MSINIGKYQFEGPHTSTDKLEDRSGIYAILCWKDGKYTVTDIGESAAVKTRIEGHDRKTCWNGSCSNGTLAVAVYYTPGAQQSGRMAIEQELRDRFNPPCGER